MFGEVNIEHFDELVECYAIASAYTDRLDDLEREIVTIAENLTTQIPCIHDFSNLLESRMSVSDERIRHTAWLMQHVYGCRAWCVNQSICLKKSGKKGFESPLVDQVRKLGIVSKPIDYRKVYMKTDRLGSMAIRKIDAMLVDRRTSTIYVVNGQCDMQTRRFSRTLRFDESFETLFGNEDRFIINARCRSSMAQALVTAKHVLEAALPSYTVKCILALVADPECGWRFQCHDVTRISRRALRARWIDLNDQPVDKTHHDFKDLLEQDGDPVSSLPRGPNRDDYLRSAPVDRPIRSMMILNLLLTQQQQTPGRLAIVRAQEIALKVAFEYGIAYPRDMYRHDLLELERARLVKRARNKENAYGLTPKGIGRVYLMELKFDPRTERDAESLLEATREQARLWAGVNVL